MLSLFQMVLALVAMILGIVFFGYIIASVAASLANADAQRARYQEKLTAIQRYLKVLLFFVLSPYVGKTLWLHPLSVCLWVCVCIKL